MSALSRCKRTEPELLSRLRLLFHSSRTLRGSLLTSLSWRPRQISQEPVARQPRHFLQRARLLKEVCRARNDHKFLDAAEPAQRPLVQLDHRLIATPNNQQRWRSNARQIA